MTPVGRHEDQTDPSRSSQLARAEGMWTDQPELREAVILGLLHGPLELVPVSSSAHVEAIPWLLRWRVAEWSGEERKELEVALHAGSAAALLIASAAAIRAWARQLDGRRMAFLAAALAPPVVFGLSLEAAIAERLRGPCALSAGLLAGAVALVAADRSPHDRAAWQATPADGAWLGVAQASALVPGVSRSGATLAAARLRRFDRSSASELSWETGLGVLVGAAGLKGVRLVQRDDWPRRAPTLAAATVAAFASTLVCARVIGFERSGPLWPWAAWRLGLAAWILAVRQNRSS